MLLPPLLLPATTPINIKQLDMYPSSQKTARGVHEEGASRGRRRSRFMRSHSSAPRRFRAVNVQGVLIILFALGAGCVGSDSSGDEFDDSLDMLGGGEASFTKDNPEESGAGIWNNSVGLYRCSSWHLSENYATGRYNAHRFRTSLPAGGTVRVTFRRTSGIWAPAIVVFDRNGEALYEGAYPGAHPVVTSIAVSTGAEGSAAEVDLEASTPVEVDIYVTSWEVLASGFDDSLPRDARYEISMQHECPDSPSSSSTGVHDGVDQSGVPIPRAGLSNSTLRSALGVSVEPYGEVVTHDGSSYVSGRVSWFGGPDDTGVTSSETGAITGERLRSLNSPLSPSVDDLTSRPEDFYFAAMRFDYGPAGVSFWRDARLLVVNSATGSMIVVRPVDWGPNTSTRRTLDLSPQAMVDLDLATDDVALVAFAEPGTPLGRVW